MRALGSLDAGHRRACVGRGLGLGLARNTAFPVVDPVRRAVGTLIAGFLQRRPHARWMSSSAGERDDRDLALLIGERKDIGRVLEQPAFARVGRAAVSMSIFSRSGGLRRTAPEQVSKHQW